MFSQYSKKQIFGAVVGALFFIGVILVAAWTLQYTIDEAVETYKIEKSKTK